MGELIVDFVARDPWQLVLVEKGPWPHISTALERLQDRLYGCLDAAIDGHLAELYPQSVGQVVTLRVDCYSVPKAETAEFFGLFSSAALELPDYKVALAASPYLSGINFAINFS